MKWSPKRGIGQEQIEIIATEKDFQTVEKSEQQEIGEETQVEVTSQEIINEIIYKKKSPIKKKWITLLFGDTATGKTYISQTFSPPILIIDTEFGRSEDIKEIHFPNKEIFIADVITYATAKFGNQELVDDYYSINNMMMILKAVEEGKIKVNTVIVDSVSDLWEWLSSWMRVYYSKQLTKEGKPKANPITMEVDDQKLWKLANKKHQDFMKTFDAIRKKGIEVVLTAREKDIPDYVTIKNPNLIKTEKDLIQSQKRMPQFMDNIFRLSTREQANKVIYIAKPLKLKGREVSAKWYDMINYDKIKKLVETGEV